MSELTVICARPDGQDEAVGPPIRPVLAAVEQFTDRVVFAGRFPGKAIDEHLTDRVVVIGEESQLAAVLVRLLRSGRLGSPETGPPDRMTTIGYVALTPNTFTRRWKLPVGPAAVAPACTTVGRPIPVVRDDAGGILIGTGIIERPTGTVYVDEHRLLAGPASRLVVQPDDDRGVTVTVEHKRSFGLPPKRDTRRGRAVSIGFDQPTEVVSDGIARPRPAVRWTWYAHTEPMYLAY